MKLGIIGSGTIVQEFLPKLCKLEGLEIKGIQGVTSQLDNIKKLCNENNIELATNSFDTLLQSGIDTLYVAVPNALHFEYCKKGLENGMNIIVEKPMTSNDHEAKELAKIAKERGLFLFEAITTLYLGNYKKIKEWLQRIGDIKIVQSQYSQYSRRYDAFQKGKILPVFDPKYSGGALMDLNLYNLHYVMGLFGKPENYHYYPNIEKNIDTSGMLVLQYPNFVALCLAAKDSKGSAGGIIQGTKGCIKSAFPPNLVGEVRLELNDGTIETFDDQEQFQRVIPEFKTFIQAINNHDLEFSYKQLDKSIQVCEVQTGARLQAGILFPGDQNV